MAAEPRDWVAWINAQPEAGSDPPRRLVSAAELIASIQEQFEETAHQIVRSRGQMVYADGANTLAVLDPPAQQAVLRHGGASNTAPAWADGIAADIPDGVLTAAKAQAGSILGANPIFTSGYFADGALAPLPGTVGPELIQDGAFTGPKLDRAGLVADLAGLISEGNVDAQMRALLAGSGGGADVFGHGNTYDVVLNSQAALNTDITGVTVALPGGSADIVMALNPFTVDGLIVGGVAYSNAAADLPLTFDLVSTTSGTYVGTRQTPPRVVPGVTREESYQATTYSQQGSIASSWTAPVVQQISSGNDVTLLDRSGNVAATWTPEVSRTTREDEQVTIFERSGSRLARWTAPVETTTSSGQQRTLLNRSGTQTARWTPPRSASEVVDLYALRTGTITDSWTAARSVSRTVSTQVWNRTGTAVARWTPPVTTPGTAAVTTTEWNRTGTATWWYQRRFDLRTDWRRNRTGGVGDHEGHQAYIDARTAGIAQAARLRRDARFVSVQVETQAPSAPTDRPELGTVRTVTWYVRVRATTAGTASVTTPGRWSWSSGYSTYQAADIGADAAERTARAGTTYNRVVRSDLVPSLPSTPGGISATTRNVAWRTRVTGYRTVTTTTPGFWTAGSQADYDSALAAANAVSTAGYSNIQRTNVIPPVASGDGGATDTTRDRTWQVRVRGTSTTTTPGSWAWDSTATRDAAVAAAAALDTSDYTNVVTSAPAPALPTSNGGASARTQAVAWTVTVTGTATVETTTTTPGSWAWAGTDTYAAARAAANAADTSGYSNVVRNLGTPPALPTRDGGATGTSTTVAWSISITGISTTSTTTTTPGFWTLGDQSGYDSAVVAAAALDVSDYTNVRRTITAPVAPAARTGAAARTAATQNVAWQVRVVATSTTTTTRTTPGFWTHGSIDPYLLALNGAGPFLAAGGALTTNTAPSLPTQDGGASAETRSTPWSVIVTETRTRVVSISTGSIVPGTTQNVQLPRLFTVTARVTLNANSTVGLTISRAATPATIDTALNPTNTTITYAMPLTGILAQGESALEYGQLFGDDGNVYEIWPGPDVATDPTSMDVRLIS